MSRRSRNNNPPQRRGAPTAGADYASWLMLVPKDKRKEIAEFIEQNPVNDYDDLVSFSCKIMADCGACCS